MTNQPTYQVGLRIKLAPLQLPDHPQLEDLPKLSDKDPAFGALVADLAVNGQLYPVLINQLGQVVDGRNRRNALDKLGKDVECEVVAQDRAMAVIVGSLVHRRHLTKGAIAYLLWPSLEKAHEEFRRRQQANLRRGNSPSFPQGTTGNTNDLRNWEEYAESIGLSRKFLHYAKQVHDLFGENPVLREEFEPKIMAGEIGLERVQCALDGRNTPLKNTGDNPLPDLCKRDFHLLTQRFATRWEKAAPEEREAVKAAAVEHCADWPWDLVREIYQAAKAKAATQQATATAT